jgi:P-type E1-E2 ATPase
LLIAAPVAFVAGMGRAARRGVIVKNADVLERFAGLRSAAFDKTGTLTGGKPEVVRVETADAVIDPLEVLSVAAALERSSGHVLAHAVVLAAAERGAPALDAQEVRETPGTGVAGSSSRGRIMAGTAAFAGMTAAPLAPGETAVYVRAGDRALGRIVLSDPLRPEAADAVAAVRSRGIEQVVMLTGDSRAVADPVARELGITEADAELRPLDKARIIHELQPRPVMMVGDGINDAPVLAAADVGVAVASRGATIASETADAVLAVDDLGRLAEAMTIARQTRRIARQSVWLGVGISVAVMLVASTGVLPPLIGALVQEGIDLLTIANALRATRSRAA